MCSWISPPRRSTRSTRTLAAGAGGGTAPCGGAWPSARWADAGCNAPHGPTARSADVVDLGAASGPALTTDRADSPLGEGVRWRCPHWRPPEPDAWEARIAAQVSVKVASRSRTRNLNCSMRSARSMRRVRACWATGSPVGLAVTPRMWTRRVETSSTNRTYRRLRKTVSAGRSRRPRSLGLGGQELLPGQAGAAWCRVDAASFEEQPHRARCDLFSKPGKFTVDAPGAPRRVLRCHPQDQATQLWHRRGPTGLAVRVGPAALDQVPMPAQHCRRRHESMEPMLLW